MPSQYPDPRPEKAAEGRPWWKACCMGCCLGAVLLLVAIPFTVRFLFQSGPTRVSGLPENFPPQLLLFRPEEATEMLYYPAGSKSRALRVIQAPISWISRLQTPEAASTTVSVAQVGQAIQTEISRVEGRDTVAVRWESLNASRDDVLRFYAGALKQAGMPAAKIRRDESNGVDDMVSQRNDIRFSMLMEDDSTTPLIVENVSVVVEYVVE